MSSWLLGLFILAVWCLWVWAAAAQVAARDARRGIPEGQRGGVSLFPIILLFPAAFWWIAWRIDQAASPWGSSIIGSVHSIFAVWFAVSFVRDWRYLRTLDRAAGEDP